MDESRAATTVMDKNRHMVQTEIYLYFCREGNEIHNSGTLIQLILRSAVEPDNTNGLISIESAWHASGYNRRDVTLVMSTTLSQIKINCGRHDEREHHRDQDSADHGDGQRLQHL